MVTLLVGCVAVATVFPLIPVMARVALVCALWIWTEALWLPKTTATTCEGAPGVVVVATVAVLLAVSVSHVEARVRLVVGAPLTTQGEASGAVPSTVRLAIQLGIGVAFVHVGGLRALVDLCATLKVCPTSLGDWIDASLKGGLYLLLPLLVARVLLSLWWSWSVRVWDPRSSRPADRLWALVLMLVCTAAMIVGYARLVLWVP